MIYRDEVKLLLIQVYFLGWQIYTVIRLGKCLVMGKISWKSVPNPIYSLEKV